MIFPVGRGSHVEYGYALAKEKPIVFYSLMDQQDTNESWIAFYGDRKVHFDLEDAILEAFEHLCKGEERDIYGDKC